MQNANFLWLSLPILSGSLMRIKYSKVYSLAHTLLLNVFSALKGTHFYISFEHEKYFVTLGRGETEFRQL